MMTLAKEAAAFAKKRTLKSPDNLDSFTLELQADGWRLDVRPLQGQHTVVTGLSAGEANRARQKLSDENYIGKIIGGSL